MALLAWEEALEAAMGAVDACARLAEADPEKFEGDLGLSLSNISVVLDETGRRDEALQASEWAVELQRRQARTGLEASEVNLAKSPSRKEV